MEIIEKKRLPFDLSSCALHIIAMVTMLCDHMWATVALQHDWLSCIGRIAFPIFAFMIVEGFYHTSNIKKYLLRMLIFALIAEIPFDLMYNGLPFYLFHQNVYWTYIVAILGLWAIDTVRKKGRLWLTILVSVGVIAAAFGLGYGLMLDFYGTGILLVYIFYFFRGRKWWCYLGQFIGMYWINITILGGYYYPVTIFGHEFELYQQAFAMLALIPIWLYRGRQGHHSKPFKYFCYAFYPAHILILALLMLH